MSPIRPLCRMQRKKNCYKNFTFFLKNVKKARTCWH
jgi:hypothetical protein